MITRAVVIVSLALVVGGVLGGCFAPLHVPPKRGQPAATVKFRINHVPRPTGALRFNLFIDRHRLVHRPPRIGPSATWTRVKPGWRTLDLRTMFYVRQAYTQTYTVYTSYKCGSSTCRRSQTRTRTAYRTVPTGVCKRALAVWTQAGKTYLISYSYLGNRSCHITCHQQTHARGGRFHLTRCAHTKVMRYD